MDTFCTRNAIPRQVLHRFLRHLKSGEEKKRRGRPSLLSVDVMIHLCERTFFFSVLVYCVQESMYAPHFVRHVHLHACLQL